MLRSGMRVVRSQAVCSDVAVWCSSTSAASRSISTRQSLLTCREKLVNLACWRQQCSNNPAAGPWYVS